MKPLNITRPFLLAALLSIAFMSASIPANAGDHNKKCGYKNNHRSEYREGGYYGNHYNGNDDRGKGNQKHYKEYKHEHVNKAYKHDKRDCYDHPKYGRVYNSFEHKPYILRHSQGNYYYSDNRFYIYHDGIGYCVSEPPSNVYFRELPFHCTRVYSRGSEYYRNGDLFFRLSARGYVIVPAPVEVNFSIKF